MLLDRLRGNILLRTARLQYTVFVTRATQSKGALIVDKQQWNRTSV